MFYRIATKDDFEKAETEFLKLPVELKTLIEKTGNIPKARKDLYEKWGYGFKDAYDICVGYSTFIKAKEDFENGKTVYTNY